MDSGADVTVRGQVLPAPRCSDDPSVAAPHMCMWLSTM
eukprot:CAMPEP_0194486332 /NCGR_PEP_ID=MMETSP0253-20130528/7033_1 /TAXON_ID=2966 /ORGANISM="Noctiluca scintillans" /LENGTH=37 /DNA_ID= /DNA_START= /DNA_END= /DNA_ORIENTATION=